jgi:drug/metabolite transporter (DMT)-like permease
VFESWKLAIVVATVIYGVMDFSAKVALGRGARSRRLMLFSSLSVTLLALFSLLISPSAEVDWGLVAVYALANSLTYGLGYLGQLETLRRLDANAAFPLVKTASAFAVLMGIVFLAEVPSLRQDLGILASFAVIAILFLEQRRAFSARQGILAGIAIGTGAAVAHAISMTVGKLACTAVPRLEYIFLSYLMLVVWSLLLMLRRAREANPQGTLGFAAPPAPPEAQRLRRLELAFGVFIGVLNFVGYLLVLDAFSKGPLSVVQPVFAMAFLIPTGLAFVVFREKFGPWRLAALAASLLSLWLILA